MTTTPPPPNGGTETPNVRERVRKAISECNERDYEKALADLEGCAETPTPMTDGVVRAMEIFESATRIKPSPAQLIELSATLERRVNRMKGLLERARKQLEEHYTDIACAADYSDRAELLADIDAEGKE